MSLIIIVLTMAIWSFSVKEDPGSEADLLSHGVFFVLVDQDHFPHQYLALADLASADFKVVFVLKDDQQAADLPSHIEWMTHEATVFSHLHDRFKYVNRHGKVDYQAEHPPESEQLLRWALGAPVGKPSESVFLGQENVTLQKSHTDCAAACTMMLLERTGRPMPQDEVYAHLGRNIDFASLLDIKNFLKERSVSSSGFKGSFTHLKRERGPVIIQVGGQHFVVLVGFVGDGAVILDPASGRHYLSREALQKKWNGFWLRIDETR